MIDLKAKPFNLDEKKIRWVEETLASMTTEEKCGQLFCVLFKQCIPEEFDYVFSILSSVLFEFRMLSSRYRRGKCL